MEATSAGRLNQSALSCAGDRPVIAARSPCSANFSACYRRNRVNNRQSSEDVRKISPAKLEITNEKKSPPCSALLITGTGHDAAFRHAAADGERKAETKTG